MIRDEEDKEMEYDETEQRDPIRWYKCPIFTKYLENKELTTNEKKVILPSPILHYYAFAKHLKKFISRHRCDSLFLNILYVSSNNL